MTFLFKVVHGKQLRNASYSRSIVGMQRVDYEMIFIIIKFIDQRPFIIQIEYIRPVTMHEGRQCAGFFELNLQWSCS